MSRTRTAPFQATLDQRVTAVCAALRTAPRQQQPVLGWAPAALLAATAEVLGSQGLPGGAGRFPAARQQMACYAAVYGRHFLLTWPWTPTASGQADLLRWDSPDGRWLLDAPRATHADAPLRTASTETAAALAADDPSFLGVRLLALAAPGASRLLLPAGELTALPALPYPHPVLALATAG
jgi:hypothetical protein